MYTHIHTRTFFKLGLLICTRWRYTERVCKDCLLTIAVFVVELMMYSSFGTAGTTSKLYTHARTHGCEVGCLFYQKKERVRFSKTSYCLEQNSLVQIGKKKVHAV